MEMSVLGILDTAIKISFGGLVSALSAYLFMKKTQNHELTKIAYKEKMALLISAIDDIEEGYVISHGLGIDYVQAQKSGEGMTSVIKRLSDIDAKVRHASVRFKLCGHSEFSELADEYLSLLTKFKMGLVEQRSLDDLTDLFEDELRIKDAYFEKLPHILDELKPTDH